MAISLPKLQPQLLQSLPYEVQEWIRQLNNLVVALGGTVTQVSVTTSNGVSGSVANPTSTPAITISLGVIAPTSVQSQFKSSDGSAGISTTVTTASLVGKTITIKDGIITGFA